MNRLEGPHLGVLNVGVTRYPIPLGSSDEKKFTHLRALADWHVVGLSQTSRYQRAHEPVELYLLPLWPSAALRLLLVVSGALVIGMRLVASRRARVVLSQSPYEGIAGILLRWWGRLLGRRVEVVTEIHGDWEEAPFLYEKMPVAFLARPVLATWSRFVLRRSDRLRTISSFLEDRLREAAPDVPIHRFPTYTDFELFRSRSDGHPHDGPILAIGGLYPVKGFSFLVRSMERIVREAAGAELWIVGDGPLRQELEREARALGLQNRVRFLGSLDPGELRECYEKARMLVLPSLSEGLGRVVWEAMASGLPVVASNVGGIPDLVEDGVTGFLVPPEDVDALTDRILLLFRQPEKAREMGRVGRRAIEGRFSTESYVEGYRRLFDAVTS